MSASTAGHVAKTACVVAATTIITSMGMLGVASAASNDVSMMSSRVSTNQPSFSGCPKLSEGDQGDCVRQLQNALNTVNSNYHLASDGKFGPDTRIAVLDFQGRNHLGADGIVGSTTASELARQAQQNGSVASPRPGRTLTPQERCATLGMITYKTDRCIPDGVVGSGLSPTDCLKEEVGAKAYEEAIKQGASEEAAKLLASKAISRISGAKSLYDGVKCMFVTNDPKELEVYKSVPMP
jgi:peptidoglycan hydrolase-like protein with peptidoglycan-binding domain